MAENKQPEAALSAIEERDQVKPIVQNGFLEEGATWYILSFKWWQKWCDYSNYNESAEQNQADRPSKTSEQKDERSTGLTRQLSFEQGERPGPIDNTDLVGEADDDLLKGIQEQYDYMAIPEAAWTKLHSWYGGSPVFARKVIARGRSGQAIIEMYPLQFDVIKADRTGNVPRLTEADMADPNSGLRQAFGFSRVGSPADMLADVCSRLRADPARSRLWSRPSGSQQEWALVEMGTVETTLEELCGGEEALSLLLETRTGEGWPRDVVEETGPEDPEWASKLAVGDLLDAQDKQDKKWYESTVVEINGDRILVHFKGWSSRWDEWIDRVNEPARIEPLHTKVRNWRDFHINDRVEAKREGRWHKAVVRELNKEEGKCKLHWIHFGRKHDEWVEVGSDRLAENGTHIKKRGGAGRQHTEGMPEERGVVGLHNLGNTCFMNSMLQCLSNCQTLAEHFLQDTYEAELNTDNALGMGGRIAEAYGQLQKDIWSGSYTVVVPSDFKQQIGEYAPQFAGYQQQDSQELMNFLLDGLHEDLNLIKQKPYVEQLESDGRPDAEVAAESWERHQQRNKSFIVDTFQGQLRSHVTCNVCDRESITFDPFMSLSVPLPVLNERTVLVTLVGRDGANPPTRYGVKVSKQGRLADLRVKLSELSGVPAQLMLLSDVFHHRVYRTLNSEDPIRQLRANDTLYVYELAADEGAAEREAEAKRLHAQEGLAVGTKVKCRWKSMKGAYYNGAISEVNDDGTYSVLFADGDSNLNVKPDRIKKSNWVNTRKDPLESGFYDAPDAMVSIQLVQRKSKVQKSFLPSFGNNSRSTVMKELFGYPLVLSFRRDITRRQLCALVWEQIARLVTPGGNYDEENPPYTLLVTSAGGHGQAATETEVVADDEPAALKARQALCVDWSAAGFKKSFDKSAMAARLNHSSFPRNAAGGNGGAAGLPLAECFDKFVLREQLDAQNTWYCSKCKEHRQAFKKFDIWKLPDILVVHLKRFQYQQGVYFVHRDKIETVVDFPIGGAESTLDLSDYVVGPQDIPPLYDLFAVSNHSGGLGGGHYTAYGKNWLNGKWYNFNDSSVSATSLRSLVSQKAYVLFYKRRPATGDAAAAAGAESKQ